MRRAALVLIFVSGVIMAVMFFLLVTFDISAHKEKFLAFISEGIDREVSVGGKIELELSLNPMIIAEHIHIGNSSWSASPYLAEVRYLEAQVALLPLLVRKLKIQKFRIIGAAVHLETNQEGDPNWRMRWHGRPVKPRIKVLPDIPDINVENLIVTFHGKNPPGIVASVGALEGNVSLNEPFKLAGDLTYGETPLHLSLKGERLENNKKPFDIRCAAPDMAISCKGVFRKHSKTAEAEGQLLLKVKDIKSIAKLFGKDLNVHRPLDLSAQIEYRSQVVEFRNAKLETTGADIHGGGVFNPKSSPSLFLTLENNVIDLAKFIKQKDQPKKNLPAATHASSAERKIQNFIPNHDMLNNLSMEVQIDDLHLVYEKEKITTITTRLSIIDGKLLLSPWQSRSPTGSSIKASFFWDTSASPSMADLSLEMEDLDYGLILTKLDIRNGIVGKLDMRVSVKGHSSSFYDFLGTANGELEIVLDKGRTPRKLLELWSDDLVRLLIPTIWFEGDLTDLNCAVGRFEITNGIVQSNLLLLDTPRITVAGETMVNLKTEEVSCLFKPKNKEAALLRYGRPIKVSGTLSDLEAEPVGSNIIALGKLALGLSYPASIILLFGDLGTTETNPCKALLHQELDDANQQQSSN